MSLRKSFAIALRALGRNRLKTALTLISLTIGVGTVLVMSAVGSGARKSIAGQIRAAGMNILVIKSGNFKDPFEWNQSQAEDPPDYPIDNPAMALGGNPDLLAGHGAARTLSMDDAAGMAAFPGVMAVSASVHGTLPISAGETFWVAPVRGEQASVRDIRRVWTIKHGRFFTSAEEAHNANVAVLGTIAADGLFGSRDPVGEWVTVRGERYRVIGVITSSSWIVQPAPGDGQFDAIYLPVGTAQKLFHRPYLDNITVALTSTGDATKLARRLITEMRSRHRLNDTMPSDFTVVSQANLAVTSGGLRTDFSRAMMDNTSDLDKVTISQLTRTLERAGRTMHYLLVSIAAVSLLVGGIGIMNIMLLSVTERTREIGIRREVGARSVDILWQFLIEAVVLSIAGGLLGIALGIAASAGVEHLVRWTTEISWLSIAISFTVSAAVGIIFGYYPARQAARVTPMTALRYE